MFARNKSGFTLIEIMLVVIIIMVLAAMVVPNLAGRGEQARQAAAQMDIDVNLATALDLYEFDNGRFPTTEQGLRALLERPVSAPEPMSWNGPYLKRRRIPRDPWGNEYVYMSPGTHNAKSYDLFSHGPDGIAGTDDDIVNWGAPESFE